jgi:hypothetical protein
MINDELDCVANLEDWLKQNSHIDEAKKLQHPDNAMKFEDKINDLKTVLNDILEYDSIVNIMNGNTWEKVYFDWGDMR